MDKEERHPVDQNPDQQVIFPKDNLSLGSTGESGFLQVANFPEGSEVL